MGKRKLEKVKAWARRAEMASIVNKAQEQVPSKETERSTGSSPDEEAGWLKPSELPDGRFSVTAIWPGANEPARLNLFDHLNLIDVKSISEIKYVGSSTHFPPEPYSNTGRGPKPYGQYYAGLGSGSAVFRLDNGDSRALSLVLTLDKTGHGDGSEHVNGRVVGWPARTFNPDNTIDIDLHKLPAEVDITLRVAEGSSIEKTVVVRPKDKWQPRTE